MKTKFLLTLAIAATTLAASAKDETMRSKRELTACDQVRIEAACKLIVTISPGAKPALELTGTPDALEKFTTEVRNHTLVLDREESFRWKKHDEDEVVAYLTISDLDKLQIGGSGKVEIHGTVTGKDFELEVGGAGKVVIDNMNVGTFLNRVSGSAIVEVNGGKADNVNYIVSGTGKLRAFPLQAKKVSASVSGTAKGDVTATDLLSASVSGIASIHYKGNPKVDEHISGTGKIVAEN